VGAMIKYDLKCDLSHPFEGWFSSSLDYEKQAMNDLLTCPICGNAKVERAIVAPSIKRSSIKTDLNKKNISYLAESEFKTKLRTFNKEIEKQTIDVGENFAEEARMIYKGEKQTKAIRGTATKKEEKKLKEEGVPYIKLPWIKDN
tara:strand:- start:727 stop:1161 length:435 start_codon:yes stop_codon:yes gene_type:complete